jgi:3-hydroxyisobutyrate dehydrogenase-like beta-hydroxyacid dehydrogenase
VSACAMESAARRTLKPRRNRAIGPVSPGMSRRVAEEHAQHGQGYIAAPVLGNRDFARVRKLFVLAAGPPAAMLEARPLLEGLGQRLFVIGEDAASANLVKLAANVLTATTLECMGEVLALMRKGGVDGHLAFDVLTNSRSIPGSTRVMAKRSSTVATSRPD